MKILKFGAVWCPGCHRMKKIWDKINEEIEIDVIEYDLDDDLEAVNKWEVGNKVPLYIFLKNGEEVKRVAGEKSYLELIDAINEVKSL